MHQTFVELTLRALAAVAVLGAAAAGQAQTVPLGLGRLDQVQLTVTDLPRAAQFYEERLGLRQLFAQDDLALFDLAGVRLLLGRPEDPAAEPRPGLTRSTLYLRCADLALCVRELERRGIVFDRQPELVARQPTHDLWIAFFRDPDGNSLALTAEVPRGYRPADGADAP